MVDGGPKRVEGPDTRLPCASVAGIEALPALCALQQLLQHEYDRR
jgi:hypothetical protein